MAKVAPPADQGSRPRAGRGTGASRGWLLWRPQCPRSLRPWTSPLPDPGRRSPTNHSRGPSHSQGQGGLWEKAPYKLWCADSARPCVALLAGASGSWRRLCLASVMCRAGRQRHGPWQHPRKPLIFLTLSVIRAAQRGEHGGRCGFLPAARSPAGAAGLREDPSERSSHIYRSLCSVFLVASEPGAVRTWV